MTSKMKDHELEFLVRMLGVVSMHFDWGLTQKMFTHKHHWFREYQKTIKDAQETLVELNNSILAQPLIKEAPNLTESSASGLIPQAYPHTGLVEDDSQ